ncbi:MAG: tyrosine-type recombinase/integrase [Microcystaceae cyanobacterium]
MNKLNPNLVHLHPVSPSTDWDQVLNDWLSTKRSPHTQRVYRKDIENFLTSTGETLGRFLTHERKEAHEILTRYKGSLINQKLSPATINRRLAAIKSLVAHAYACGHCEFTLETVKGERLTAYRDTTGIDLDRFKAVLATVDLNTIKGVRDYAILILLWSNALRRSEVAKCDVKDFDGDGHSLRIYGKGRGTEDEVISLGNQTVKAISDYIEMREDLSSDSPLFVAHKAGYQGHRLSTNSIYNIVKGSCEKAGISKVMSPHRIRHSAITTALDATDGDVRRVQKLSRHKNLNTLLIYDDNRGNLQGEVTDLLDGMV